MERRENRRRSKDKTIENKEKYMLKMIKEMGLGNTEVDKEGKWTFGGKPEISVIDYAAFNIEAW